jgi:hypothetical protein
MTRASTKLQANFLIFSSLSGKQSELANRLLCGARQAYLLRDKARQKIIGERLIDLSPRFEHIGRCYVARAAPTEKWLQGCNELKKEFESLINEGSVNIRAVAMTSFAAVSIQSRKPDQSTSKLLMDASALAYEVKDILTVIQAQSLFSLLHSINGDHQESLNLLRGLQPLIEKIGSPYEVVKSDFYNSVAFELAQSGKWEEAKVFTNFFLKSPHLSAYPEWLETAKQIYRHCRLKNLTLTMGEVNGQIIYKKRHSNVLQFRLRPAPIKRLPLMFGGDAPLQICNYPVDKIQQLENFLRSVVGAEAGFGTNANP